MRNRLRKRKLGGEKGLSLVEMLIVVAIIAIMGAVALPNIAGYLRLQGIRGATQQVAGEIQQARVKAIMSNANVGMTFAIVDADSYRWVADDALLRNPADDPYGPPGVGGVLRDLPEGSRFVAVAAAGAAASIRFNRLGSACIPAAPGCGAAFPQAFCNAAEAPRCADTPAPATRYISPADLTIGNGNRTVTIEDRSGYRRTIGITPGGRVMVQQ